MPDILAVFSRWWKWIATFTLIATSIAAVTVWLLPEKYVSIATALPASSFAADKGAIFNTNIQQLYSSLGSPDDLDRIVGTARLDTVYIAVVNNLNLTAHYGFNGKEAQVHAVQRLKRRTVVSKSEWGELKIKVWDSDRDVAAQAANGVLKKLQQLHQDLQNQSNQVVLQKLQEVYKPAPQDSVLKGKTAAPAVQATQSGQESAYQKLLSEYSLVVATNPPVLLVVEAARPAPDADHSEKWAAVIATAFAALLFSGLLALYAEGKKKPS